MSNATKQEAQSTEMSAVDQAAAWFARRRSGPWLDSDAKEFAAWLKAEPEHTTAWESYERLWKQLDNVRDHPSVLALREQASQRATGRQLKQRFGLVGVAVAASAILAVVTWHEVRAPSKETFLNSIAQQVSPLESTSTFTRDVSTEIGERSMVVLADGSRVTLNTASAVRAKFSGGERRIALIRGEAFFDVAKDQSRPFIVSAGSRQVVALGTSFGVRLDDRQVKVTLVEGKVRVVPTDKTTSAGVLLDPGSALIAKASGADKVERLDATRAMAWTDGRLVFDGETLAEVVAEMNRYSIEKLEIANSALNTRQVSGVFEPTSSATLAKALESYGLVRATRISPVKIILDSPQ